MKIINTVIAACMLSKPVYNNGRSRQAQQDQFQASVPRHASSENGSGVSYFFSNDHCVKSYSKFYSIKLGDSVIGLTSKNSPWKACQPQMKQGVFRLPKADWGEFSKDDKDAVMKYLYDDHWYDEDADEQHYIFKEVFHRNVTEDGFIDGLTTALESAGNIQKIAEEKAKTVWDHLIETRAFMYDGYYHGTYYIYDDFFTIDFDIKWDVFDGYRDIIDQFMAKHNTLTQESLYTALQGNLTLDQVGVAMNHFIKCDLIEKTDNAEGEANQGALPVYHYTSYASREVYASVYELTDAMRDANWWIRVDNREYQINDNASVPDHYADFCYNHPIKKLFDLYYDGPQKGQLLIEHMKRAQHSDEDGGAKQTNGREIWIPFILLACGSITIGVIYAWYCSSQDQADSASNPIPDPENAESWVNTIDA